jgi:hypothetical protein
MQISIQDGKSAHLILLPDIKDISQATLQKPGSANDLASS